VNSLVEGKHSMIGPSKILTVSYGTFSCTLEGFDDPFNTMRAIAEYFRDLAAEDRYFGAEPPTPDAAMLHKIAEREVQRRVEAKIQDNSVILRTGDAMQAPAFAPSPTPQPSPAPTYSAPVQSPMPDGVAAKLLRIRAAVANAELAEHRVEPATAAPTAFAPAEPILADYIEDQHADDVSLTDSPAATFAPENLHNNYGADFVAETVDADALAQLEATLDTQIVAEAPAEAAPQDAPAADDAALADLYEEDLDDADFVAAEADDETLSDWVNEEPAVAEAVTASTDADPDHYDVSEDELADLRALDAAPAPLEALVDAPVEAPSVAVLEAEAEAADLDLDYDEVYDEADVFAEVAPADTTLDEEFAAELAAEAEAHVAEAPADIDPALEEIDSAYDSETTPRPGPSEKALRARARVLKVRRDDATSADGLPAGAAAEIAAMMAAQEEEKLRRELRALQEQPASAIRADDFATTEPDHEEPGSEDDARRPLDAAGEQAVTRLIEQTNEEMAVPENRRRLSAIAHLKAAVAATVADRFTKGDAPAPAEAETKRLDPYREDLARVVRPQNLDAESTTVTPRPAPLVLVSAQRIDRPRPSPSETAPTLTSVPTSPPNAAPAGPVRPRRVTSAMLAVEPTPEIEDEDDDVEAANLFTDARGFAEFSERLGANSLAEILEAAAAYSVCIEGRPYFSRPQLMSQIGALSADSEYTREDGLRTFGALLRQGRIQKIKRGQFVLTENSRYLAEARALAG
jgi:hypothetical protein